MSDTLQSNVLTVDAQGNISADFTGTVHAEGLTLPAARPTPQPINRVAWTRPTDGEVVADMVGTWDSLGIGAELLLEASAPDFAQPMTQVALSANGSGANNAAQLSLFGGSGNGAGANTAILSVASFTTTLLDDLGRSSFLQLHSTQRLQLNGGIAQVSGGGAGTNFNTAHGLGRAPAFYFVQGLGWGAPVQLGTADATNIPWQTTIALGAGSFYVWVAFG